MLRSVVAGTMIAGLFAGPALAQAPAEPGVVCGVSGYDVIVRNEGTEPVAAGTVINWSVKMSRSEGEHTLAEPLEPAGRVFLSGVLGSSFLGSKTACELTVADGKTPA